MKKITVLLMSVMVAFAAMAEPSKGAKLISLADARGKIGLCVKNPKAMKIVMQHLSAADQKSFVAEVNKAISELPVSNEKKTATYLNVNKAALTAAAKGNLAPLVAEVFATVPPESLTVLNERLGADLFNRAADPSKTYTDEQFTKIAEKVMESVNERVKDSEDGATRSAFAVLMLVHASNGSPANLADTLIDTMPEAARNEARTSWIPAALGNQQQQSYEPILGASETAGVMPSNEVVIKIAGPQQLDALLGDVVEETPIVNAVNSLEKTSGAVAAKDKSVSAPAPANRPEIEPQGYQNQYN